MKLCVVVLVLTVVCVSCLSTENIHKMYLSRKKFKVGEWTPPEPPAKESSGLKGKVPMPKNVSSRGSGFRFKRFASAYKGGQRSLLQEEGGESPMGSKVPHNWFG